MPKWSAWPMAVVLLTPLGHLRACHRIHWSTPPAAARPLPRPARCSAGYSMPTVPLDSKPAPLAECEVPLYNDPQPADAPAGQSSRSPPASASSTACSPAAKASGGDFAAGGGKAPPLMLARSSAADVNVIALVGERSREVGEFCTTRSAKPGLAQSVVIVSTSDRPALERARATYARDRSGGNISAIAASVLLMIDSVTRFARALRDAPAGGRRGRRRGAGFSAVGVFRRCRRCFERAGSARVRSSITAFYSVLMDDVTSPIRWRKKPARFSAARLPVAQTQQRQSLPGSRCAVASASRLFTRSWRRQDIRRLPNIRAPAAGQISGYRVCWCSWANTSPAAMPEPTEPSPAARSAGPSRQRRNQPVAYADSLASLREALADALAIDPIAAAARAPR